VADGWCWFVLREEYCWLVAGGWFVVREKYCWLMADKPSEQGAHFTIGNQLISPFFIQRIIRMSSAYSREKKSKAAAAATAALNAK
jgi:hypothetical protein